MELAQLREVWKAEPFKPFTMRLVDGRTYFVPHRDFLHVPPGTRHTVVSYNNEEAQAITILEAIMIASVGYGDTTSRGQSNGMNGVQH